jgi:hypothetical protein
MSDLMQHNCLEWRGGFEQKETCQKAHDKYQNARQNHQVSQTNGNAFSKVLLLARVVRSSPQLHLGGCRDLCQISLQDRENENPTLSVVLPFADVTTRSLRKPWHSVNNVTSGEDRVGSACFSPNEFYHSAPVTILSEL